MYVDAFGLVSDSQAITATAVSTNTIDLTNATIKRQIGTGEPVGFGINVESAADFTTGNETYTFEVIQSANADLSSPDVIASETRLTTALTLGTLFFLGIGPGQPTKRYIGMRYTVGGTTPLITVSAWFGPRSMFSVPPVHYSKNYAV